MLPSLHALSQCLNQALGCFVQPLLMFPDPGCRMSKFKPMGLAIQFLVGLSQAKPEEVVNPSQKNRKLCRFSAAASGLTCSAAAVGVAAPDIGCEIS